MMTVNTYSSKKELRASVGKRLRYEETSWFRQEYVPTGTIYVARRPHLAGGGREFFAEVEMKDNLIVRVS